MEPHVVRWWWVGPIQQLNALRRAGHDVQELGFEVYRWRLVTPLNGTDRPVGASIPGAGHVSPTLHPILSEPLSQQGPF